MLRPGTVSLSVHLVCSSKTRLSLSHHTRSTLRDQAANTNFDNDTLAMQHPVHVRLAVRASNHIDPPRLIQYTSKTGTSIYQTRPASATRIEHPAAPLRLNQRQLPASSIQLHLYDSTNISYSHRTSCRTYQELYIRPCKYDNKLSSLLYLLPRLFFLHCLLAVIIRTLNLNHLRGQRVYRLRNMFKSKHF